MKPTLVRDLMSTPVYTIDPSSSLRELIDYLRDNRIHGTLVAKDGQLVGVVSYSDVLTHLSDHAEEPGHALLLDEEGRRMGIEAAYADQLDADTVNDVMTPGVLSCQVDQSAGEVAQWMLAHNIHRAAALEGDTVRGVISATDLLKVVRPYEEALLQSTG